jgi:hypothetical protein
MLFIIFVTHFKNIIMNKNFTKTKKSGFMPFFKSFSIGALSLLVVNNLDSQTVQTFTYTGAIQTWTVPAGVTSLTIEAIGARGGNRTGATGGTGAGMKGTFTSTPGQVLSLLVGQCPGLTTLFPGGGGGSFVASGATYSTALPMIVGGGGGGAEGTGNFGINSPITTSGTGPTPGINGNGAPAASCGSGGGGFFTSGGNDINYGFIGGAGFQQGGAGGYASPSYTASYQVGGFGGGGAANYVGSCNYRGGSGGGYSGGSAQSGALIYIGEAGGSYNGGTNQVNTVGAGTGNGTITITYLSCTPPVAPTNTTAAANLTVCGSGSQTLSAIGTGTVNWFLAPTAGTAVATGTTYVTPTITTTTTFYAESTNSCSPSVSRTAITVTVNALPSVSIALGSTVVTCAGQPISLTASGANTYTWNTGATTSTIAPTPTANVTYTATGTNSLGCTGTATQSVAVNALPTVSVSSSATLICAGQSASLTASGASTYSWNTSSTNTVISITPSVTTSYTVTGTGANTCSNSVVFTQSVSACTGLNNNVVSTIGAVVYPNPNAGMFTIELNNGSVKTIEVMDVTGRVVLANTSSNDKIDFNTTTLSNGIYYVRVQSNNSVEVIKIVKQ